ncbi:aromatic acid exporter family protein [Fusobacterium varium]|uniref:aromatic acid exporter family protein n=1 Tax=Fusobacterium varium TaxID=856 RepID=UPI000E405961|nr:aromatic acid exporter family protein [Fusobacterium varium]MCF2673280.1 aromatic acid exporter family protein [Fusobacterium varium]RGJ27307.1 aromatic acid exporter family protein [Fusobacterium varium]
MSYFDHRVIKTAFGTFLAIYLAQIMGISYGVTAGIVTIISIQTTKKESVKIAVERFIASLIGLFIAAIFFYFFGYTPFVFGLFILIFMPVCLRFNLFQGFLVTVVLATHILTEKNLSLKILSNEILILVLGALIAIILNLYMPDVTKKIKYTQENVDNLMKKILSYMSDELITGAIFIDEDKIFKELRKELDIGRDLAYKDYNNALFYGSRYEIEVFNMKRAQYKILVRMRRHFYKFFISSEHTFIISEFTRKVGSSIGVDKLYLEALAELEVLREKFKNMPLPKSRVEFESRAVLLQFFNDIEEFLEVKKDFMKKYTLDGEKKI